MGLAQEGLLRDHLDAGITLLETATAPSAGQCEISSKTYENMQLAFSAGLFDGRRS